MSYERLSLVRDPEAMVHALVADSRLEIAGALSLLAEPSIEVVGCADRIEEVLTAVDSVQPDIVVLGPSMLRHARQIAYRAGAALVVVAPSESAALLGNAERRPAEAALHLLKVALMLGSLAPASP